LIGVNLFPKKNGIICGNNLIIGLNFLIWIFVDGVVYKCMEMVLSDIGVKAWNFIFLWEREANNFVNKGKEWEGR
jgi:hypothetical protein